MYSIWAEYVTNMLATKLGTQNKTTTAIEDTSIMKECKHTMCIIYVQNSISGHISGIICASLYQQ